MTALRSGKEIPIEDPKKDKQHASSDPEILQTKSNSKEVTEETIDAKEKETKLPMYKHVATFSQRLNLQEQITPNQEILDIFKQAKINTPLHYWPPCIISFLLIKNIISEYF